MAGKTKIQLEDILEKIKLKHPSYILYPENNFTSINNIVNGKCITHNEPFTSTYNKLTKYSPCKKCISEKLNKPINIKQIELKDKINSLFGVNKFDLSFIGNYTGKNKIKLKCNKHEHEFEILYTNLINKKQGCPKCSKETWKTKRNTQDIINEFELLNKEYDYSLINNLENVNTNTKLPIICNTHGIFYQKYHNHLTQNCPKCSNRGLSIEEKINNIPDNNRFTFNVNENFTAKEEISVTCKKHSISFQQKYNDLQQNHNGCPKCNSIYNKINPELENFILSLNIKYKFNDRSILKGKELDIYFPEHNVAIEYNGNYWHSNEVLNNPSYHKSKTDICDKKNIHLIHIWENDWDNKKEIIKSIIKQKLKLTPNKIYARKCIIKGISNKTYKLFLEKNHLQGNVGASTKIGLYYQDELVGIMSFGKLRKSLGLTSIPDHYELIRYCSKINTHIVGGASKLFKYFIKTNSPKYILSYANRDISNGNLYKQLNFEFIKNTPPSYWYIKNNQKINRFSLRKQNLIKLGYNPTLTEKEIISLIPNMKTIYNSGNKKYEFKIK